MDGEAAVVDPSRRKRRKCFLLIGVSVLVLAVVLAIVLGVISTAKHSESLKSVVIKRCETFLRKHQSASREHECEKIWETFEQAYVGRDPCDIPLEAYDPLFSSTKEDVACNTMLLWSGTNKIVHEFTENRDCLVTLEDTLLGFLFNRLTWCSKNGSTETFTTDCPVWSNVSDCPNNPVRSFWLKASANFATIACGDVSVMLNGSWKTPFNKTSIFGSVEVKRLDPNKVKTLTVLLVTKDTDPATCNDPSFQELQHTLNAKIAYNCKEVSYSRVEGCISDLEIPCSDCLRK